MSRAILFTGLLLTGAACLETKICLERGCNDLASITVRKPDGTTAPMAVVMDVDGRRVTCQAPPARSGATICDDDGTRVMHREAMNGRLEQVIAFSGTPRRISVTLMENASVLAQKSFELVYMEVRPNGENCEPVCKQRAEIWELP